MSEALVIAHRIQDEGLRSSALKSLAEVLDASGLADLLENEILQSGETIGISRVLQHWTEICRLKSCEEYPTLVRLVARLSSVSRQTLLKIIPDLSPLLIRLGGEAAVVEAARAIIDTTRWWP